MAEKGTTKEMIWVSPNFTDDNACSGEGTDVYHLTYEIPGTSKDGIKLRVIKDGIRLTAPRGSDAEYWSDISFCCEADPSKVKASYSEGVLKVDVPIMCPDPFQSAVDVHVE
ncbi:MAG: hypothetical protein RBG13Loki_0178 [Promethearchaeota archaeon CR_4]|nr:MAG: hypothetical protein RBG13Loki_0178 [Candidatus Lokiarchaeota archaeon CR_4]